MGILDYLSTDSRKKRALERAIKSANNKFKPKEYRQPALMEVIETAKAGNEDAITGLLSRFAVNASPSHAGDPLGRGTVVVVSAA